MAKFIQIVSQQVPLEAGGVATAEATSAAPPAGARIVDDMLGAVRRFNDTHVEVLRAVIYEVDEA